MGRKIAYINLVDTTADGNDYSVATIRANKNGTRAVVQFVEHGELACFATVRKAWEWLAANRNDTSWFVPTGNYPSGWRANFV